jgi:type IX secretion system PorP/SprF family membrane protein
MKRIFYTVILMVTFVSVFREELQAQQHLTYNHYFINPFLYNPSYISPSGYSELYLNYRKQWSGIAGAPVTGTLNLHLPLSYKSGLALTAYQDEAGLIQTTTGLASFSYAVFLGKRITDLHKIGFGISAGYTTSRIKTDELDDLQDPVLGNNTSSLDGQFGIHYQFNRFRMGFAIPRLFNTYIVSEESFTRDGITQIRNTISSIGYDFAITQALSIEPIVTYRTFENLEPQLEAVTSVKLSNVGWIGGGYRQNYGALAFLGVSVKEKIKLGYSYEFATQMTDRIGYGSHEVQVVIRLGKKQFTRPNITVSKPAAAAEVTTAGESRNEPSRNTADDDATKPEVAQEPAERKTDTQDVIVTQPRIEPTPAQQSVEDKRDAPKDKVTKLSGEGLTPGHYVVVGAFTSLQNALDYTATLKRSGYPAHVAFHQGRAYYIVHMLHAESIEEARMQRDKYRQMSRYSFRDTWILSIE